MMTETIQTVTNPDVEAVQTNVSVGDVLIIGGKGHEVTHIGDSRTSMSVQNRTTNASERVLITPDVETAAMMDERHLSDLDVSVWVAGADGARDVFCPNCGGEPSGTLLSGASVECSECHVRWSITW